MNEAKDSTYYARQAERCLRWSLLVNDRRSIAELEKLAADYKLMAEYSRSLETASTEPRPLAARSLDASL